MSTTKNSITHGGQRMHTKIPVANSTVMLVLVVSLLFGATPLCSAPILSEPHVLVSDYTLGQVYRFDAATGAFIDTLVGGVPVGEMSLGTDGFLYISSFSGRVYRVNSRTGEDWSAFASTGLDGARGLEFGPNGNLFVASANNNKIVEFDAQSGAFVRDFVDNVALPIALRFGSDGDLYVARGYRSGDESVERFSGSTGDFIDTFVSTHVSTPQNLIFGPDGSLYVANQISEEDVTRFDGSTGTFLNVFVTDSVNPQGMLFLPNGDFLLATGGPTVRRYDGQTGSFMDDFLTLPSPGSFSFGLIYMPTVPEPGTLALLGLGLLGLGFTRRRAN